MLEAFNIAATGMHGQQLQVETIANNLSNVNTIGYKKSRVEFEDLMYRQLSPSLAVDNSSVLRDPVGTGSSVSSITKIFSQGDLKNTDRQLDIAIQGEGMLEIMLPNGEYAYSRTGSLQVNNDGMIVNGDGYQVSPNIQIPSDAKQIIIDQSGKVSAIVNGRSDPYEIGQIELSKFMNTSGLKPVGDNLYLPTMESGDVIYGTPGEGEFGTLAQGFLEVSNVDLIEEMTNLMLAQRSYEMNAKMLQAADDIMGIINNLRR